MIVVQVWPHPFVRGWSGDPLELEDPNGPPEHEQTQLDEAFADEYATDTHSPMYAVRDRATGEYLPRAPRLRKASLAAVEALGLEVVVGGAILDIDAPKSTPDVADWYTEQLDVLAHSDVPIPLYRYRTRGGYRLIWALDEPVGPADYERLAANLRALVRRETEGAVDPDEACKDWTRCYRLPYVVRDGERQTFELETPDDPTTLSSRDLVGAVTEGARRFDGLGEATPAGELPAEIPEGGRNNTLARLAGSLAGEGADLETVRGRLHLANEERCDPPLDRAEVDRIARSIHGTEQTKRAAEGTVDGPFRRGDHAELADRLIAGLGDRTVYALGSIHRYHENRGLWIAIPDGEIRRTVMSWAGSKLVIKDKAQPLKLRQGDAEGALRATRDRLAQPDFFDNAPAGLGLTDGFLLVDGEQLRLVSHAPDHRCTYGLDRALSDIEGSRCDRWRKALVEWGLDEDVRQFLAEWVGYALLGLAPQGQIAVVLVGEGANGKSVCVDVISGLFPRNWRSAVGLQDLDKRFGAAQLVGKRLNAVSETDKKDLLSTGRIKALITGDMLQAERKYQDGFPFRPQAANLFAVNRPPIVADDSDGFWRRLAVITFDERFGEDEREELLAERILAEESDGIIAWALAGAEKRLARGKYTRISDQPRTDWRRDSNPVETWLEERTDREGWTIAADAFRDYDRWSRGGNFGRMSKTTFGARLRVILGPYGTKRSDGTWYALTVRPIGTKDSFRGLGA